MRIRTKADIELATLQCLNAPFCDDKAIQITKNCVCFTNPCINLFVPSFVIREYHPKVLERLHLLQCIATYLQHTLLWVPRDTLHLVFLD